MDRIKVAAMQVPPFSLSQQINDLGSDLEQAVLDVLRSGQYIGGAKIQRFEQAFADNVGTRHAVGCNSGTDALILALRALGIGPGDQVITCAFSFFATAEAISSVGAEPVFVDANPDTYLINLDQIEAAITPATKALIPVHLFGRPVAPVCNKKFQTPAMDCTFDVTNKATRIITNTAIREVITSCRSFASGLIKGL